MGLLAVSSQARVAGLVKSVHAPEEQDARDARYDANPFAPVRDVWMIVRPAILRRNAAAALSSNSEGNRTQ